MTLKLNGLDVSKRLSTYVVNLEIPWQKVITTMDDEEHPYPATKRPIVTFSFLPMTEEESKEVFDALSPLIFDATYTNMYLGEDDTRKFRVVSDLESTFLLTSIDGKRRYNGNRIQLRALKVM